MNATSRARIINDDRPSIIVDAKKRDPKSTSPAANLIARTLNLYGKEQVAERQRLEQSMPKKTPMSWLDKLSSTAFVKGETLGNDPKIQGNLQTSSTFAQDSEAAPTETNLVKPTFADLDKQRRFEQYLGFSESERKLKFASVQPLSMTEWDRDQEVGEFENAARMCEKIDGVLASQSKKLEEKKEAEASVDLDSLSEEDRMQAAARMKMFGKLTRTETEWKPAKLVCVRFNIAEPSVGVADEKKEKKKFSIFDSLAWNEMSKFETGKRLEYECEPGPSTSSGYSFVKEAPERRRESVAEEESPKPVTEKQKAFEDTYEKVFGKGAETEDNSETKTEEEEAPVKVNVQEKKDLYKSIFLSSSDESEPEAEEPNAVDEEKLKIALLGKSAAEKNVERNSSPPRGIFAKLDFDSLLRRPDKPETTKDPVVDKVDSVDGVDKVVEEQVPEVKMEEDDLPADAYGPALPKAPVTESEPASRKPVFTGLTMKVADLGDGKWVEKSRDKKKSKKEKKKHKHKERSRSKSRKKSKKEKRH